MARSHAAPVGAPRRSTQPSLRVRNLRVELQTPSGPVDAVRDVSFVVQPGERVGIVGESGSGKSLTALALLGLLPPIARVSGNVEVSGIDLLRLSEKAIARQRGTSIGMVFQEPATALDPVFSIGAHLEAALVAHSGMRRAQARRRAIELLGDVGITAPARRVRSYPHELSGGMRQRVTIAMAIARNPAVLIADEPTTALDVTVQAQVLDLLNDLTEQRGMSLVLITHDLAVLARSVDRVLTMYAGEVIEDRPVADVVTAPAHPYTAALLHSMPAATPAKERLRSIPGTVPSPGQVGEGCGFRERCSRAGDDCRESQPMRTLDAAAQVRCCRPLTRTGVGAGAVHA